MYSFNVITGSVLGFNQLINHESNQILHLPLASLLRLWEMVVYFEPDRHETFWKSFDCLCLFAKTFQKPCMQLCPEIKPLVMS